MTIDYGPTIHLPKTDFPRRAGLAQKEPEILKRWEKMALYDGLRQKSKGKEKFILHMGPPFANGNIHLGHVLSTVLKDIVCRSHQMLGYDAPLVPGFDCHGLPIEWKIEEEYRSKKITVNKDDAAQRVEFLKACRAFAEKWVGVQSSEFQRLGINADWKNPYKTMDKKSEATIAANVHKFLLNGALYRGSKPVMWSIPEQTALAEAEIEYKDVTSDTVWVKFPIKSGPKELEGASVVAWTTTPWTLPGNRALAYGADLKYAILEVTSIDETSENKFVTVGDKFVVCEENQMLENFASKAGIKSKNVRHLTDTKIFESTICRHPLHGKGYDFDVPMLAGDFVTTDTGTGFVHIAPGHGEDDHRLGVKNKIEVPETVSGDGKYLEHVPLFAGAAVYWPDGKKGPANKLVTEAILANGNLVAKGQITHSYPHSWRSKAPVIFRTTPQWFISMEKNDLRKKALDGIKKTKWFPERGQNRIGAMVEQRGDWCVSRQRVWGVPLAIFVDKKTRKPLDDEKVLDRIIDIFEKEGSETWFNRPAQDFLGSDYKADDYEQVKDIVDVWMESGITQEFVLKQRPELHWPADLYLEGSDQHRGWFQSSLLVGCGTGAGAPYKNVLTHGFILDEKGHKMSKSQGNVTAPAKLMEMHGADILRLWVAGSGYTEDIRFGEHILQGHIDVYRRLRNTFCYLLGSLDGFKDSDRVAYKDLGEFDQWVLHRLYTTDQTVRECIKNFDFLTLITTVHNFCARDLSALYFDVCKDALYCEALSSVKRRAIVTVLDQVTQFLCHWLSPILCFTAEEAWMSYKKISADNVTDSIHLSTLSSAPKEWHNPVCDEKWQKIIAARSAVTGALEIKRGEKVIGASLEASPKVYVADTALAAALQSVHFADICITSGIEIASGAAPASAFTLADVQGVSVVFEKAGGTKCTRCWKYTEDTGSNAQHPELCARCTNVVQKEQKSAAA